jgi:hypothetical protein
VKSRGHITRTAPGGPEPITADPTPPAVPPTPAPTPVTPAPAATFDPEAPEVKAYLAEQRKAIAAQEGGKARDAARATARNDALAEIAKTLGIAPKDVDPAAVAAQLASAQTEARMAKVDRAIDRAARKAGADEDLVGAVLARSKAAALAKLDPAADTFEADVSALVEAEVAANPRLKLETTTPAGGQAPVANGFQTPPTTGQRLGLTAAIAQGLQGMRKSS